MRCSKCGGPSVTTEPDVCPSGILAVRDRSRSVQWPPVGIRGNPRHSNFRLLNRWQRSPCSCLGLESRVSLLGLTMRRVAAMTTESQQVEDHYRIYQSITVNLDRENHLINHRITWAIIFSAGIFAASAILASAIVSLVPTVATGMQSGGQPAASVLFIRGLLFLLMAVLAGSGVFFSIRTREGVRAAHSQLEYLVGQYAKMAQVFEAQHGWPRPIGDKHDHLSGNNAAMAFPELMYWTWLVTALIELSLAAIYLSQGLRQVIP